MQQVILALCAAAVVVIPVLAGVVILTIQQYGKIKQAIGAMDTINGTLSHHLDSIMSIRDHVATNQEQIGEIKGAIKNGNTATAKQ